MKPSRLAAASAVALFLTACGGGGGGTEDGDPVATPAPVTCGGPGLTDCTKPPSTRPTAPVVCGGPGLTDCSGAAPTPPPGSAPVPVNVPPPAFVPGTEPPPPAAETPAAPPPVVSAPAPVTAPPPVASPPATVPPPASPPPSASPPAAPPSAPPPVADDAPPFAPTPPEPQQITPTSPRPPGFIPVVPGAVLRAALAVDYVNMEIEPRSAFVGGNSANDWIYYSGALAFDRYNSGSTSRVRQSNPNAPTCCLLDFPHVNEGMTYSFVSGGLTLSKDMEVFVALSHRDAWPPKKLVRAEGDLAIPEAVPVALNRIIGRWANDLGDQANLWVLSNETPASGASGQFRICWSLGVRGQQRAPVSRVTCTVHSLADGAYVSFNAENYTAGVKRTYTPITNRLQVVQK